MAGRALLFSALLIVFAGSLAPAVTHGVRPLDLTRLMGSDPTGDGAVPSDLDAFMAEVMARRDDNWKKLQQYILDEDERLTIADASGRPVYGFNRDYTWFIRDGTFVRSPVRIDGVAVSEGDRRRYEAEWLADEKQRAARERDRDGKKDADGVAPAGDVASDVEPRFVRAAYFLRFTFEPGRYGLVGRERLDGVEVLRVEYYPSALFKEGRTRPNKKLRERDDKVREKINEASLVTLWIEPASRQILQFTFANVDWDFLPGRAFARIDGVTASMRMTEAFPSVWLPQGISGRCRVQTAAGSLEARYDVSYHDYKQASVTVKVPE